MTSSRGKRRKERPRQRNQSVAQPTTSRVVRPQTKPAGRGGGLPMVPLLVGGAVVVGALVVLAYLSGIFSGAPGTSPSPQRTIGTVAPPDATPLADPPSEPAGDGTRATIEVPGGQIVIELFNQSSPVATQNFVNLAEAGYYAGVVFHRIVPDFVIQGGDPDGTGTGGPGYGIPDEPVVGEYVRGTVAMARSAQPNSQGSQFFIVLDDTVRERLPKSGGYAIFGRVLEGMELVDEIAAGPSSGQMATNPVAMDRVTIQRP
jgi:peptidyl-prolyl cis-trans isomerase B (cyclophilin B)